MANKLYDLLADHEGLRLKAYRDTVGKLTIGIGRNLDDVGISKEEAYYLLANDVAKAQREAATLPWFAGLNEARQAVVVSMIFNLGFDKFMQFKRTTSAIATGSYGLAATYMLESLWAKQVGKRAATLSTMMKSGEFQF
jgi:lysozyme